jgi:hypothetical protein
MWQITAKRIGAAYSVLVGKPQGKRSFIRLARRCNDNIKMDFQGIVWKSMGWIDMAPNRGTCGFMRTR